MKHYYSLTAVLLVLGTAGAASANTLDYSWYEQLFGEPVTAGATGTPMRASQVPLDMDIITQADISRSAARDIPDLLRHIPGVSVRRNGNGWADVAIRGYNQPMSSRLLVLLNGRQVYQEDYGYVNWSLIPVQLSEIRQIEVVRGPNTALYGFNATSGVVNIITNNALYDNAGNAGVNYGLHHYGAASLTASRKMSDKVGVNVSVGGWSEDENVKTTGGLLGNQVITDPQNYTGRVDTLMQVTDKTQLGFSASDARSDEAAFIYGSNTNNTRMQERSFQGQLSSETDYGLISLQAYHTLSQKTFDNLIDNESAIHLNDFQLSDVFKIGTDHTFRAQAGYRDVSSDIFPLRNSGDTLDYHIASVSGLWNWKITDQVSLTNALRFDEFMMDRNGAVLLGPFTAGQYDRDTSGYSVNSGIVYTPNKRDTWRASYARGVDLPSVAELAIQLPVGGNYLVGSPQLDIGENHHFSVGYEHKIPEYQLTAKTTAFYQINNDMISSISPFAALAIPFNAIDSKVLGGEVALDGKFSDAWDWGIAYSYSNVSEDVAATATPLRQSYGSSNANHMVDAKLGYSSGPWTADTSLTYYSHFNTQATVPMRVDGELQLDGRVSYQITPQLTTAFTVIGATDDSWSQTGGGVVEAERQAFVTLNYKF